jgi:hypothetical protein
LPDVVKPTSLFRSSARTHPWSAALVLASAAARLVMVGPVDRNSADSSAGCGWLIITST